MPEKKKKVAKVQDEDVLAGLNRAMPFSDEAEKGALSCILQDPAERMPEAKVLLAPAPAGTGIIAGGPMRAVFEVMGVTDIVAKSLGSSNPYNMVRATLDALKRSTTPAEVAAKRGKSVEDLFN